MQAGCRLSNLFNAGCVKFCRKDALLGLVSTRPKIGNHAVGYWKNSDGTYTLTSKVTIICSEGSAAEDYAIANSLNYSTSYTPATTTTTITTTLLITTTPEPTTESTATKPITTTTTAPNAPIIILPIDESKIYVGNTVQLIYYSENDLRWFTDNANVASIDQNGLITITGSGEAAVIAIDSAGNTAEIKLNVPEPILYGDVNLDETVSLIDVICISKYNAGAMNFNESQIECADCCSDGVINASDTTAILKYVVESIESLPIIS